MSTALLLQNQEPALLSFLHHIISLSFLQEGSDTADVILPNTKELDWPDTVTVRPIWAVTPFHLAISF